jgi:hypothetical protein
MLKNKGFAIISLSWGVNQMASMEEQVCNALSAVAGISPDNIIYSSITTGTIFSREDHMINQDMIVAASNQELYDELFLVIEEHGEDANADAVLEVLLDTEDVDGANMCFVLITPDADPQTFEELDKLLESVEEKKEFESVYLPKGIINLDDRINILREKYRQALTEKIQFTIFAYFEDNKLIGVVPLPESMSMNFSLNESAYTDAVKLTSIDLICGEAEFIFDFEEGEYIRAEVFPGYQGHDIEQVPNSVRNLASSISAAVDSNEIRGLFGDYINFDAKTFLQF